MDNKWWNGSDFQLFTCRAMGCYCLLSLALILPDCCICMEGVWRWRMDLCTSSSIRLSKAREGYSVLDCVIFI